jgi:hypothetical protein
MEAVNNLNHFSSSVQEKKFVFAGFNALNAAEEKSFNTLLLLIKQKIYWDADQTFLNDPYHDAGLFVRRFKKTGSITNQHLNDCMIFHNQKIFNNWYTQNNRSLK